MFTLAKNRLVCVCARLGTRGGAPHTRAHTLGAFWRENFSRVRAQTDSPIARTLGACGREKLLLRFRARACLSLLRTPTLRSRIISFSPDLKRKVCISQSPKPKPPCVVAAFL